jgi:hypothetical protein
LSENREKTSRWRCSGGGGGGGWVVGLVHRYSFQVSWSNSYERSAPSSYWRRIHSDCKRKWTSNSFFRFVDNKSEKRVGSFMSVFLWVGELLVGGPRSDDGFFVLSYMIHVVITVI